MLQCYTAFRHSISSTFGTLNATAAFDYVAKEN